jgi:DNA-directed RNA polymerase specialized sigma24 family protein
VSNPNFEVEDPQPDSSSEPIETPHGLRPDQDDVGSYEDDPFALSLEGVLGASAAIDALPELQRQILMMHFGLTAPNYETPSQVAQHFGISEEEAHENLKEALAKIMNRGGRHRTS